MIHVELTHVNRRFGNTVIACNVRDGEGSRSYAPIA